MTIKTFERPLLELSHNLVFQKAKLVDKEYKLSVKDLSPTDRLDFFYTFMNFHANIDVHIQELLDHACQDRMYAEMETFGGFDA